MTRPPRRLILHVGQSKAGSTAIQNYLEKQRDALRAAGVLFPKTFFLRRNAADPERTPGHLGLVKSLDVGEGLDAFLEEYMQSGCSTVVLSIENLFQDQPDRILAAIGEAFCDWHVELLAVLRPFPEWLASRYIEEVMAGSLRGGLPLDAFTMEIMAEGAHDYAGRMDLLMRQIGAAEARVINYDAARADGGLIPAFMAMTGIPETDPDLARDLKANVREKWWFMIEASRRMNCALRGTGAKSLGLETRRLLEGAFRQKARAIAADLPDAAVLTVADIALPPACRQEIRRSTRRLQQEYGLATAFPAPAAPPEPQHPRYQHRQDWPGTDALVRFGLETALTYIARNRAASAASDNDAKPTGTNDEAERALAALSEAQVSLHLDSPLTALWSACLSGKMPVLISAQNALADHLRLQRLKLPSEIICLDPGAPLAPLFSGRHVDLVVASAQIPWERIDDMWKESGSCAKLVVVDHKWFG